MKQIKFTFKQKYFTDVDEDYFWELAECISETDIKDFAISQLENFYNFEDIVESVEIVETPDPDPAQDIFNTLLDMGVLRFSGHSDEQIKEAIRGVLGNEE